MESIVLNSCSKINLGLNILRKREDGYHDLETIFYPVKLCDTISFAKSDKFEFICANNALAADENNLVIRAKNKIEKLTGSEIKAHIKLAKYIPLGGGLGGGSSNAAVTLKGLNLLFKMNIPEDTLYKLALELGSDVPFFLNSTPCFASSRGEKLKPIEFRINYPILIVNPKIHVETRWAFQRITPVVPERSLETLIEQIPIEEFRGHIHNDFEEPVFKAYPEIKELKEYLYNSGAVFALLSGSGSTVYGIFRNFEQALKVRDSLSNKYLTFLDNEIF